MSVFDAALGTQDFIKKAGIKVTAIPAGTTKYQIPLSGAGEAYVILGVAVGASITSAKVYPCAADGISQRAGSTPVAFAAFVNNTAQAVHYTGLAGERFLILEVTASAAVNATAAEFTCR